MKTLSHYYYYFFTIPTSKWSIARSRSDMIRLNMPLNCTAHSFVLYWYMPDQLLFYPTFGTDILNIIMRACVFFVFFFRPFLSLPAKTDRVRLTMSVLTFRVTCRPCVLVASLNRFKFIYETVHYMWRFSQ